MNVCPNCTCNLDNKDNVIVTKESELFKGNNVYMMCKSCGYVMVYNKNRELIFSLDNYKDDEEVMKEVASLLADATQNNVELVEVQNEEKESSVKERIQQKKAEPEIKAGEPQEEVQCSGNCAQCPGCSNQEVILLAFNKQTQEFELVKESALDSLVDLSVYDFYLLERVHVERVMQHKIHKL